MAVFAGSLDAVLAAAVAQRALSEELPWLRVRMAVHTGEALLRGEHNYAGPSIIRCARLRSCGHGGQVLVSDTAAALLVDELPDDMAVADLGVARLRDLARVADRLLMKPTTVKTHLGVANRTQLAHVRASQESEPDGISVIRNRQRPHVHDNGTRLNR